MRALFFATVLTLGVGIVASPGAKAAIMGGASAARSVLEWRPIELAATKCSQGSYKRECQTPPLSQSHRRHGLRYYRR